MRVMRNRTLDRGQLYVLKHRSGYGEQTQNRVTVVTPRISP